MGETKARSRNFECADAAATRSVAAGLAASASRDAVFALDGPLGAGKTEFVKGLAEGLGCAEVPTSPTFAVAHEYEGGRLPLFHFDFYRLEAEEEVQTSGFEECIGGGIVAVEWAGKFAAWLPAQTVRVRIDFARDGGRRLVIT